jgi:hypothetical protein
VCECKKEFPRFSIALQLLRIWSLNLFHNFGTRFEGANLVQIELSLDFITSKWS